MKNKIVFEAISDIDPLYINEGCRTPKKTFSKRKTVGAIAGIAAAALLIGGSGTVIYINYMNHQKPAEIASSYSIKEPVVKHVTAASVSGDKEICKTFRWEEMMNVQRYTELSYNDAEYSTELILVHEERRGNALGTATLSGFDEYADAVHTTEGNVIAITGIDTNAAVAVAFPEEPDRYYAYTNHMYIPETLEDFITALNLREDMKTGLIYVKNVGESEIVYEDISTDYVWNTILSDTTLVNEPNTEPGRTVLSISTSVDVLGEHNMTMSLTEDGYLWTNLLATGKYFRIGEDKVAEFYKEVTDNHQGYLYVYDTKTGDEQKE